MEAQFHRSYILDLERCGIALCGGGGEAVLMPRQGPPPARLPLAGTCIPAHATNANS